MQALLLSAYDAPSHNRWRGSVTAALADIAWTQLALPPRHFRWRIRANSLHWALEKQAELTNQWDFMLATSMVDLAGLRSLVPSLSRVPTALYFHENQFAYPQSRHQHSSVEPQMVTLYSALCANMLVFNSVFNRDTFLQGVDDLLGKMPDYVPSGVAEKLAKKSRIVSVPLDACCYVPHRARPGERPQIVWNHRWEYDKNPALLLAACERLSNGGKRRLPFVLHVTGQQFRRVPEAFATLKSLLEATESLGTWGFVPRVEDYRALLARCDLVLSTADHDFQGLSVLEAVAAGCLPLLPAHQVYPEWFEPERCYPVTGDVGEDAQVLAQALASHCRLYSEGRLPEAPSVGAFAVETLLPEYQRLVDDLKVI